ncbi:MAG: extracellular solute-binding protein [Verrucomicrobia bacterium]|nr:extracellular solute-binding protein [Verrucomicrobiota bacterium]
MKFSRARLRRIGFRLLLVAFLLAAWRLATHTVQERDARRVTLRFAHWQMEPGIREALDVLARDYERLHPDVRVEQMLIPESIYVSWATTHVAGGSAPDLVEIGRGILGNEYYRYFDPITDEINAPNPYNRGTALEHVPWRNTFVDGLANGLEPRTLEFYGASLFASTTRLYCNEALLREITGRTQLPRTLPEWMELCQQVRVFAQRTGREITPLIGSPHILTNEIFNGQMQRIATAANPRGAFPAEHNDLFISYLNGGWSLDDPAVRDAAELSRLVGGQLPPGVIQLGRASTLFQFVQGHALMYLAYSQDSTGVLKQASFPISVLRLPLPGPATPRYGAHMHGPSSEGALATYGSFGIVRSSAHREVALDFLRFITSRASDEKFSRVSGSLPVIVGIEPSGFIRHFMPDSHGYPPAPTLQLWETGRAFSRSLHYLYGAEASSAAFLADLKTGLADAMRTDLTRTIGATRRDFATSDPAIEGARQLLQANPADAALRAKYQALLETQNEQEAQSYYTELRLKQSASGSP